jgi:hypothetical protein
MERIPDVALLAMPANRELEALVYIRLQFFRSHGPHLLEGFTDFFIEITFEIFLIEFENLIRSINFNENGVLELFLGNQFSAKIAVRMLHDRSMTERIISDLRLPEQTEK